MTRHDLPIAAVVVWISACALAACGESSPAPVTDADGGARGRDGGVTAPADGGPSAAPDAGSASPRDAGPAGRLDAGAAAGSLLFFDDFEYVVGRDGDTNAVETFMAEGGWSGAKTQQDTDRNPNGYLYTVDAIPELDGPFPGGPGRVLAIESAAATFGGQTDFYLQYGGEDGPADTIPANVWFQFWVNVAHTTSQPSGHTGGKLLYVCNGPYPCNTHSWLVVQSPSSRTPHWETPFGEITNGDFFINNIANGAAATFDTTTDPDNYWKMGQTDTSEHVATNRWTLVKIHFDTSTESGVFEMWMRPFGGAWVKTAEWIDGVTPGFIWRMSPEHVRGHRVLRMPTTMGEFVPGRENRDTWIYMDDFAIATSDAALPRYADGG